MLSAVARTVLLRHELPASTRTPDSSVGGSHLDWMFEAPDRDELVTFRVESRIDAPECVEFEAERIGDHRRAYLEYEGEISHNRGRVFRVAEGTVWNVADSPDRMTIEIDWGYGVRVLRGQAAMAGSNGRATWRFVVELP